MLSVQSQHHVRLNQLLHSEISCDIADPVNEAWAILVFNNRTFTYLEIGDWIGNYPLAVSQLMPIPYMDWLVHVAPKLSPCFTPKLCSLEVLHSQDDLTRSRLSAGLSCKDQMRIRLQGLECAFQRELQELLFFCSIQPCH